MGQYKSKRTINEKNYSNNLKTKDFCTLSAFVVQKNMICSVSIRGGRKSISVQPSKNYQYGWQIWTHPTRFGRVHFVRPGGPRFLVLNMNMFWMLCASFDGYFPTRLSKYFRPRPKRLWRGRERKGHGGHGMAAEQRVVTSKYVII